MTVSIGLASTECAAAADDLFAAADMALYRAKKQGRDQTQIYAGALRAQGQNR